MSSFEWKAEYSVGDKEIDRQHAELIKIIDELAGHLRAGGAKDEQAARAVFDRLANYVTTHFAYEEARIVKAGYPEHLLREHQAEHNAILRQVQDFERVFDSGDSAAMEGLMSFLYGDWLIHHICGTDIKYMPYL